jgi:hypothetical protein
MELKTPKVLEHMASSIVRQVRTDKVVCIYTFVHVKQIRQLRGG